MDIKEMKQQTKGNLTIHGGLLVSSKSPKGILRPYGMTKWFDNWKLNLGHIALYILHNDVYLDIQHENYGVENLKGTKYLKLFKWGMLAIEFLDDKRLIVIDSIDKSLYIRLPEFIWWKLGKLLEKKYINIV